MFRTITRRILSILLLTAILLAVGFLFWFLFRDRGIALYQVLYITGCLPLIWIVVGFSGAAKGRGDFLFQYGKLSGSEEFQNENTDDPFNRYTVFSTLNGMIGGLLVLVVAGYFDYLRTL